MNIFELFGTIAVNNKGANQAIDQTGKKANTLASTMGKAFTKAGKLAVDFGKTMAKGLAVGTAAMTGLVVKSMGLAGELEQNMGGADAVFGKFADSMKKKAADAYKVMGLSQSEYLATANKMGSLLKGSGFEAGEAADMTAEAMKRAADVASIMGLDISAAMESIAGAAKGNFTMMDNLGVAINDTTLKNYALEKGIKKSTAQMTTQEKVSLAMRLFLEKTADYAGNYAKENDTLAGSLTTAKAALKNFLSGAGDAKSVASALTSTGKVISKKLKDLLPHLVDGISELLNSLMPEVPGLLESLLPGVIDGAVKLLGGLAKALPTLAKIVIDKIPEILRGLKSALVQVLPELVKTIFSISPDTIRGILSELGSMVGKIWTTGIWPTIQNLFKVTLGIDLPRWPKEVEIRAWMDSIVSWFEEELGVPMENFRINVIEPLKARWGEVKESIRLAAVQVGDFLGIDLLAGWDTVTNAISSAWQTVASWINAASEALANFLGLDGTTGIGGGDARPWYVREHSDDYNGHGKESSFNFSSTKYAPAYVRNHPELYNVTSVDGEHAKGLDFVPFDNYLARLHYGETVLTRKDADAWRKGSTGNMAMLSAKFDQMQETFIQVLEGIRNQPIAINIDSKAAAVLMAKEMTKSIGNRNIQALMGMGG